MVYFVKLLLGILSAYFGAGLCFSFSAHGSLQVKRSFGLFCFLWCAFCAIPFMFISREKLKKVDEVFKNDCDLESFVEIFEKFASKRQYKSIRNYVFLCLALGYLALGKDTKLLLTLKKVGKIPNNRARLMNQFGYHQILCSYGLRVGDIPVAEAALNDMQQILSHPKWKEEQKKPYANAFAAMQCLIRMEQGDFDDCEIVFLQAAECAKDTWAQVVAKFSLGRIYLHENRIEVAAEAFSYVALYGGTSIYQKRAVKELEALGETPVIPPVQRTKPVIFSTKEKSVLYGSVGVFVVISAVLLFVI